MQKISFACEKGNFSVNFLESGEWHSIPTGLGKFKESWLTLHEESYLIAASGDFTTDENGTAVLKLDFTFLEECVRGKSTFSSCLKMKFSSAGTKHQAKA